MATLTEVLPAQDMASKSTATVMATVHMRHTLLRRTTTTTGTDTLTEVLHAPGTTTTPSRGLERSQRTAVM
jgi:hypothetical protein